MATVQIDDKTYLDALQFILSEKPAGLGGGVREMAALAAQTHRHVEARGSVGTIRRTDRPAR
jgi:hypothetical protein